MIVYELKQGAGWKWTGSRVRRGVPGSLPESEREKPALHCSGGQRDDAGRTPASQCQVDLPEEAVCL